MWMLAADKSDKICSILIWFNLTQFCSETHWNFVNVLIFVFKVEYSLLKLEVRVENYCLFQTSHLPVRLQSPALGLLANCCALKSLRKMFGIEIQHRNRAPPNQGE